MALLFIFLKPINTSERKIEGRILLFWDLRAQGGKKQNFTISVLFRICGLWGGKQAKILQFRHYCNLHRPEKYEGKKGKKSRNFAILDSSDLEDGSRISSISNWKRKKKKKIVSFISWSLKSKSRISAIGEKKKKMHDFYNANVWLLKGGQNS